MKAAIFEKPGIQNLKIDHDVEQPKITVLASYNVTYVCKRNI